MKAIPDEDVDADSASREAVDSPLRAGSVVDGAFTLLRAIGAGGMGEVWLAREDALGRDVALKFMREAPDPARAVRFAREARALAALDNPSILTILRTGVDPESGLRYLATPAILLSREEIRRICDGVLHCPYPTGAFDRIADSSGPGTDFPRPLPLSDLLESGKTLPEAAVIRLARDLTGALAAAHRAGIIHRDVKPSNILFDRSARAILADFGLAKISGGPTGPDGQPLSRALADIAGASTASLDSAGRRKFLGSPAYAAPEQFDPAAGPDTPALDWYALGAVLYRALTGHGPGSPRKASSFAPRHLSRAWDPLLDALLEPDPGKRLADPAAVLRGLRRVERLPAPRRIARNLLALWLGCLVLGLAIGTAIYAPRRLREARAPEMHHPNRDVGLETAAPPPSVPDPENGNPASEAADAATPQVASPAPQTRPQPVHGILGLVQSPAFVNPVTDFSVPDTERGLWIPTRKNQIPAGTENFLPVGTTTNRLRFVWCPVPEDSPEAPDPSLAPGFWILDRPISQEFAALVLNLRAQSRSDPVARPEDPRRGDWPAAIGGEAITPLLVSMTHFAGIPVDLIEFSIPTPGQLRVAKRVLGEHGGTLATGDVWTSELLSIPAPPDALLMNLQPVLRPSPKLSR